MISNSQISQKYCLKCSYRSRKIFVIKVCNKLVLWQPNHVSPPCLHKKPLCLFKQLITVVSFNILSQLLQLGLPFTFTCSVVFIVSGFFSIFVLRLFSFSQVLSGIYGGILPPNTLLQYLSTLKSTMVGKTQPIQFS